MLLLHLLPPASVPSFCSVSVSFYKLLIVFPTAFQCQYYCCCGNLVINLLLKAWICQLPSGPPVALVKKHHLLPTAIPVGCILLQKASLGFCFSEVICDLLKLKPSSCPSGNSCSRLRKCKSSLELQFPLQSLAGSLGTPSSYTWTWALGANRLGPAMYQVMAASPRYFSWHLSSVFVFVSSILSFSLPLTSGVLWKLLSTVECPWISSGNLFGQHWLPPGP